jgi:hypothetical protein
MVSLVRALGETAVEEVREDLMAISETLDRLSVRAAREINEVKAGMSAAVVEAEESLRRAPEKGGRRKCSRQIAGRLFDNALANGPFA